MVKAGNLWLSTQHSYRHLPDLNCMSTLLETRQHECLPSLTDLGTCKPSGPMTVPLPLLGTTGPRLQNLGTEWINESNALDGFPTGLHAYLDIKKLPFSYGHSGMIVPGADFSGLHQKGFLIFDQSENHTKLTYKYVCPSVQNLGTTTTRHVSDHEELYKAELAAREDQVLCTKNVRHQVSEGNNESEMHEDTEEINALLDSDDDENEESDSDNEYDEDDEVTSTAHSPTQVNECFRKREVNELIEEVDSSNSPNKKQKMVSFGFEDSSPIYTASSVKLDESHEYENDANSCCGYDSAGVKGSECTFGNTQSKKDKIRQILRVLESIIPGVKGKDPLLVIDETIDYLRITKSKAETLGVSFH